MAIASYSVHITRSYAAALLEDDIKTIHTFKVSALAFGCEEPPGELPTHGNETQHPSGLPVCLVLEGRRRGVSAVHPATQPSALRVRGYVAGAHNSLHSSRAVGNDDCNGRGDSSTTVCLVLRLRGSSFMRCQIRKMVGLFLAVARRVAQPECIAAALTPGTRITVPAAPAEWLVMVGFPAAGCAWWL